MGTNQIKVALVVVSCILFSLVTVTSNAQDKRVNSPLKSNLYIQPNAGLSQYYGDFNKEKFWNQNPKPGGGIVIGYQFSPVFGIRGQFLKTNLYSERADENKIFSSDLWDGALNLTININDIFTKYNEKRFFNFYIFGGEGISSYRSKLEDITSGTITYEHTQEQREFFIALGGGASFRLSNTFLLTLEYGDHTIFGGNKLDFTDNSKQNNDHYSYISAGLQIKISARDTDGDGVRDKKDRCPGTFGYIKLKGCPDKDNDGIADIDDACPDVAGYPELKGCPDTDGDGISDREDSCRHAPGKKELNGCPDKDEDGIADKDDKCPEVSGKKELAGCPDRDNDGIADNEDACPDVNGLAQFEGCPDTDGDDITDGEDACPSLAGKKELNGCPDKDNDGIADKDDKCPDEAGRKELAGCPDRDDDGIADNADACPTVKGLAQFGGCPDTDGDGIPDYKDKCPRVAGVVSNNGCPEEKKGTEIALKRTVYFDPGSIAVIPTFKQFLILDEIVAYMNENPDAVISVSGYEDGNEAKYKGLHLPEKRADYVINYLNQKGVKSSKIKKTVMGKNDPAANNKTAEARALNRRVIIKITK